MHAGLLVATAVAFTALAALALVGLEGVRSVVDARRRRATGAGGTGDITFWGLVIAAAFEIGAVACLVGWLVKRWLLSP